MFKNFKINIAFVLCTVFIFRILFINIGIISSLSTKQHNGFIKAHFSNKMKKRRYFEPLSDSKSCDYSLVEICEEGSDNDDQFKSNPLFFIQVLYSSVAGETENKLKKISPFCNYLSHTSSERCLIFQVFRI
jgi:hypothetical protein